MTYDVTLREMPLARALWKLAELPEPPPDSGEVPHEELGSLRQPVTKNHIKNPILHGLGALGGGALAFGGGIGAGYLGQLGVEKLMGKQIPAGVLSKAAPVMGGLAAVAYHTYKAKEQEQLRRALEAYQNQSRGSVPAGKHPVHTPDPTAGAV
jgi:hypothetical protein